MKSTAGNLLYFLMFPLDLYDAMKRSEKEMLIRSSVSTPEENMKRAVPERVFLFGMMRLASAMHLYYNDRKHYFS